MHMTSRYLKQPLAFFKKEKEKEKPVPTYSLFCFPITFDMASICQINIMQRLISVDV